MKKIISTLALFVFIGGMQHACAQSSDKNNLTAQPNWRPAGETYAEYYFLPDIDAYYYVPKKQFIYKSGGFWTFSASLPSDHKDFDLYSANKVVINEPGAYRYFVEHKSKYGASSSNAAVQKDQSREKNKEIATAEKKAG